MNLLINQVWFGDGNNHSFTEEWGATIIRDCCDEDWKTESVRPKGLVEKGTKVTMLKSFQNFDGIFVKCRRDSDGVVFDLDPKNLIPCGESK